jgi:hypothetical protein
MGVVEETRQIVQDFLAPELREIRGVLSGIERRLDSMEEVGRARYESIVQRIETMDKRLDSQDKRLEFHEEAIRARFDIVAQRLETFQQSLAFEKRISSLEEDKRRSA